MTSVYSEVTATFPRDRLLEKFTTPSDTLPFTIDDIKISHNETLVAGVYNQSITKLYNNYLFLIANAEITTKSSPTTALSAVNFNDSFVASINIPTTVTTGTKSLSTINELHYVKKINNFDQVVFSYGRDNSLIYKTGNTSITPLLSGNKVEHNKEFEFSNVVSVDSSDNFLFVLDNVSNTLFKFDISGFIYSDPAIERDSLTSSLPGRYLLKTVGGKGKVNRKNKLTNPKGISVFNNKVYVLDNGNFSIKVYDLNFNYITSYVDKTIFDYDPVSISVSEQSDTSDTGRIFILGSKGTIIRLSADFTNIKVYDTLSKYTSKLDSSNLYNEGSNFKKIISSPSQKNLLYILSNKSIIKFYKTNLRLPINFYDTSKFGVNSSYELLNSFDVTSISGVDQLTVCSHLSSGETKYSIFKDKDEPKKLYHDTFYTNYFSLSDIVIDSQELVNAITFNKTTEKISYNHSALFESLNKKIHSFYTSTRVPEISAVIDSTFTIPTEFSVNNNYYIGVNEPLLTDVINRPLKKLYDQQVDIFNNIKENYLNTNPPSGVSEVLQSDIDLTNLSTLRFSSTTPDSNISSGDSVLYTVTRDRTDIETTVGYYTSTGTNTLTSEYEHIPLSEYGVLTFSKGVSSQDISLSTNLFFGSDQKSFTTFLINPSGGIIDQNNDSRFTTFGKLPDLYTVNLSVINPVPIITEGGTSTFAVTRSSTDGTYTESTSVNIFTSNITTTNSDYGYIETDGTYSGSLDDFSDFNGSDYGQISATSLSGGTIVFEEGISAVFFDISATYDNSVEPTNESFLVKINNPSEGGSIGSNNQQLAYITESKQSFSITIDSSHSSFESPNYVSNVNIWPLMQENTTFQTYSGSTSFDVTLNITTPLSVYSTNIDKGAIYLDSGSTPFVNPGGKLTMSIPQNTTIAGKGGSGGKALIWLSGSNFDDILSDPVSTTEGLSAANETGYFLSEGQNGGPAISVSGFEFISFTNFGKIFGGGGGGGSGYLPVTANPMTEVSAVSAAAPGGRGNGLTTGGHGVVGNVSFLGSEDWGNGVRGFPSDYEPANGLSGGYFTSGPLSNFTITSGGMGGTLGNEGQGGDQPDDVSSYDSTYQTISGIVLRRNGGKAGTILDSKYSINWVTKNTDITSGTFSGSDI